MIKKIEKDFEEYHAEVLLTLDSMTKTSLQHAKDMEISRWVSMLYGKINEELKRINHFPIALNDESLAVLLDEAIAEFIEAHKSKSKENIFNKTTKLIGTITMFGLILEKKAPRHNPKHLN